MPLLGKERGERFPSFLRRGLRGGLKKLSKL
jgi:hypothetical protein